MILSKPHTYVLNNVMHTVVPANYNSVITTWITLWMWSFYSNTIHLKNYHRKILIQERCSLQFCAQWYLPSINFDIKLYVPFKLCTNAQQVAGIIAINQFALTITEVKCFWVSCSGNIRGVQISFSSFSVYQNEKVTHETWRVFLCKMDRTKIKHPNQLEIAQNEIWTPRKIPAIRYFCCQINMGFEFPY